VDLITIDVKCNFSRSFLMIWSTMLVACAAPIHARGAQTRYPADVTPGHDNKVCAALETKVCVVSARNAHALLVVRQQSVCRNNSINYLDSRALHPSERFDKQSMCKEHQQLLAFDSKRMLQWQQCFGFLVGEG
jgi:hypothetical protein